MVSTLTRKCSHKLRPFFNDTTAVLTQAAVRCWPRDRWETKPGCTGMHNVHNSERRQVCASRSGVEPTNKRGNLRHIAEDQAAVHDHRFVRAEILDDALHRREDIAQGEDRGVA